MQQLARVVVWGLLASLSVAGLVAAPPTDPAEAGAPVAAAAAGVLRAGVGVTDATWHVGAGAGQYADKDPNAGGLGGGPVDPHGHSTTQSRSYGVQSRLSYRALAIEGADGERVVLVKADSYLAQDLLVRRVGHLLADGDSGVSADRILLMATHNHSSPYATSGGAGVWLFQDALDLRAFEYAARQIARAVELAVADLRPASLGATTVEHRIYKGNIAGPAVADDGTPAGYPASHADFGLSVVRVDDVATGEPMAVLANFGQHPEANDAYDLISADVLGPLERMVDRDLGATLLWSQGDVGSAEGPYLRGDPEVLPDGVVRAWAHVGPAQTERGARYLADSVVEAVDELGAGGGAVPMSTDVPVAMETVFVPGPLSHPYPSVSTCRTEPTVEGDPGAPVLGLPDCERPGTAGPGDMLWESLRAHGLPVPDHYDVPGVGAVEENARIKLQAVRLGEVLLASCACEAQMDLVRNLESRTDDVAGNLDNGYDWGASCTRREDDRWDCPFDGRTLTVDHEAYERMRAQVNNDAAGWDAPEHVLAANAEPDDPDRIWGNFTHTELPPSQGYALPIAVGHAGDYNGYTVSYREFMSRDHYRKALTSYGPHTADYMNTRLVALAGSLKGGPAFDPDPHQQLGAGDEARVEALAVALGRASATAHDAWLAALPDDLGPAEPLAQPADLTRFDAAEFTWRGGSNAVDNPTVTVERLVGDRWRAYADQSGEVQTRVDFPEGADGVATTWAGAQEWRWTASFEAFNAFPARVVPGGQVPDGTYRFVVDGALRQAGETVPYRLTSDPFEVSPWTGVTAADAGLEPRGAVSFTASSVYPRTYDSSFPFVADDGGQVLCRTCTFRPWAAGAEVVAATVVVERPGRRDRTVRARLVDGRWWAPTRLRPGWSASIPAGGLTDAFGETNGAPIPLVTGGPR